MKTMEKLFRNHREIGKKRLNKDWTKIQIIEKAMKTMEKIGEHDRKIDEHRREIDEHHGKFDKKKQQFLDLLWRIRSQNLPCVKMTVALQGLVFRYVFVGLLSAKHSPFMSVQSIDRLGGFKVIISALPLIPPPAFLFKSKFARV